MAKSGRQRWARARILVVEDDRGDQEIIRRALAPEDFFAELHVAGDGEEALDYLLRKGRYGDPRSSPRPDLILLDLNLPGINGKQMLAEAKRHEESRKIPVVVVTTSARDQDIRESYELGCNGYVIKPLEAGHFIEVVQDIYDYWFELVALPAR